MYQGNHWHECTTLLPLEDITRLYANIVNVHPLPLENVTRVLQRPVDTTPVFLEDVAKLSRTLCGHMILGDKWCIRLLRTLCQHLTLAFWRCINVITDNLCVNTGSWPLAGVERSLWALCGHMTIASIRCDRVLRKPCAHGQSYNCHMWKHYPCVRGMQRGYHGHFVDTGPVPMWQCITETLCTRYPSLYELRYGYRYHGHFVDI